MNVPQQELDNWRVSLGRLALAVSNARTLADPRKRSEYLQEAQQLAVVMNNRLEAAGANRPADVKPRPEVPLNKLDTPAARRYLEALERAWDAGLERDRELYGEDIGTDGDAQMVEMLLLDVQTQVMGPVGRVRE